MPLQEAEYREWQAKRRIVSYGGRYDLTRPALGLCLPRGCAMGLAARHFPDERVALFHHFQDPAHEPDASLTLARGALSNTQPPSTAR